MSPFVSDELDEFIAISSLTSVSHIDSFSSALCCSCRPAFSWASAVEDPDSYTGLDMTTKMAYHACFTSGGGVTRLREFCEGMHLGSLHDSRLYDFQKEVASAVEHVAVEDQQKLWEDVETFNSVIGKYATKRTHYHATHWARLCMTQLDWNENIGNKVLKTYERKTDVSTNVRKRPGHIPVKEKRTWQWKLRVEKVWKSMYDE